MSEQQWLLAAGVVTLALLLVLVILIWRRRRNPWFGLGRALKKIARDHRRNVLVPDGMGGQIQLDYLVLTEHGILVLDTRHAPGVVFGGDRMDEWAVLGDAGRFGISNPQESLFDRLAAVREIANGAPVSGFVVFTDQSRFTKGMPSHVILVSDLEQRFAPEESGGGDKLVESFIPYWDRVLNANEERPPAA